MQDGADADVNEGAGNENERSGALFFVENGFAR